MPGIYLYTGNRLELLADKFADLLHADPLPPFTREIVLVQSRGMARWLALETAGRLNVWANCDCPFPNSFISSIYKMIIPEIAEQSPYDKKFMVWHLMDIIPSLLTAPHFDKVRNYLDSDAGFKLYQLAHELSDLFDQYTIFRPEMVLDWETNGKTLSDDHKWQADLWHHLSCRLGKDGIKFHRAKLLHWFEEKISNPQFDRSLLPSRISIFGISSLPPYHLRVLAGLARHADLHIFIMNPCMEFWSDIIADRDIVKIGRTTESSRELLHLEHGHTLLSSMGHLGRDFLALIQELDCKEEEIFQEPGTDTLLASIQQDILILRENQAGASSDLSVGKKISPDDESIVFQSCHSPMREVEILHDQLLDLFDNHSGSERIAPRDILVMAPDINEYAPLIRAVFDTGGQQEQKLPYTIADQAITGSSRYIEAFREMLSLAASRFTSIDVISLLKSDPVRRKFSIEENEIPILERWINHTGICWGIDEKHKMTLNLPCFNENTWRAGLDRLLLGYAMKGEHKILFEKILPYDLMEGSITELLGRFLDFVDPLFELQETLRCRHTLSEWAEILLQLRNSFILPDDTMESDSRLLCHVLSELRELQPQTSFQQAVSINVIEEYLFDLLEQRYSSMVGGTDFLTGGITFCSMLPMRSIPFKIICLLGMNDGAYPRPGRRRSFDLMSQDPMRGDRSRRHDDRYLFLETILSAREKLSISFTGQSIRETGPKPPSVLVSELMDYIEQGYILADWDNSSCSIIKHLTRVHRLQPFHPHYFRPYVWKRPNALFSYSMENCEAASSLSSKPQKTAPAVQSPLPTIQNSHNELELDELISFFTQPIRYFLLKRIGIAPMEEVREHNTVEPFTVKGLERYTLENDILAQLVSGNDCRDLYLIKKAAGVLPHGEMGEVFFARTLTAVQSFKDKLERQLFPNGRQQREFSLLLRNNIISGRLENLTETGMVLYRYTGIKPKDIIRGWIYHLVFNSITLDPETASGKNTYLAGTDNIYWYKPVSDSREHLEQLLSLFRRGLTEPLHFFPETSFAYAKGVSQGKNRHENLTRAKSKWEGNAFAGRPEKNDPYNMLCLKDINLAETDFTDLAEEFFLPVFKYMAPYREKSGT